MIRVGMAADVEVTTGNRKVWFARSHGNKPAHPYLTSTSRQRRCSTCGRTWTSPSPASSTRLGSAYTDLLTAADESSVVGVKAIGVRGAVLYLLVSAQHTESVQTHQILIPYVIGGTGNSLTLTASTDNNRVFGHVARPTDFVQYAAEKFAFIDDTQIVHFRELQSNDTIPQIEADDEDKVIGVNSDLEYELIEQTGGVPGGTDDQDASEVDVAVTNFTGNLSVADTDVQKALDTIDDLSLGGGGGAITQATETALGGVTRCNGAASDCNQRNGDSRLDGQPHPPACGLGAPHDDPDGHRRRYDDAQGGDRRAHRRQRWQRKRRQRRR